MRGHDSGSAAGGGDKRTPGRTPLAPPARDTSTPRAIRKSLFDDGIEDEAILSRHLREILFSATQAPDPDPDQGEALDFLGPDSDVVMAPASSAQGMPDPYARPHSMTLSQLLADEDLLMLSSVPELEHGLIQPYPPADAFAAIATPVGPGPATWQFSPAAAKPSKSMQQYAVPPIRTVQAEGDAGFAAPGSTYGDWSQVNYQLTLPSFPAPPASARTPQTAGCCGHAPPPLAQPAFASSSAMQKAYAAAANRFLWRLNVLEGAAAPADPDTNGLCQLSALMSELDQGLTNCLVHLGVDKAAICQLLAGNFNALPEPHEVQTMRQLLKLKLSFITIFTKAVSTPSSARSPMAGGSPAFSQNSDGSNRGAGAAAAGLHGAGTRCSSSSSGSCYSRGATPTAAGGGARTPRGTAVLGSGPGEDTNAVKLAAAAGLAAEIRQKVLERFNQKLRANACQLWALLHVLNPKPSRTDKEMLMSYTSKTSKQVTDWFTNWRARHWRPGMQILARQMGYGGQGSAEREGDPNPDGTSP